MEYEYATQPYNNLLSIVETNIPVDNDIIRTRHPGESLYWQWDGTHQGIC